MRLFAVVGVLVVAGVAMAAPLEVLINGDTVSGGLGSQEALIAAAPPLNANVTVVSDAVWNGMTAAQFGFYDLLIVGDPTCSSLPAGVISSASVYGSVVMGLAGGRTAAGNRVLVGTDPVYHDGGDYTSPGARGTIIREGIAYAASKPNTTGMYFDASCYGITVPVLDALSAGSGAWTINQSPPCGGSVSLIASSPPFFPGLSTASLQGWSCSVHESFPTFRSDWCALAVATDTPSHPTCGVDPNTGLNACGEAYILISGRCDITSQGISVSPLDATNPVGTSHTVTANVHELDGTPVAGKLVTFTVTGQNGGASGTCVPVDCKSDVNGNVSFTYFDANGAGDDTILASFTDAAGSLQTATAQKHWVGGCVPADCNDDDPCTDDTCVSGSVSAATLLIGHDTTRLEREYQKNGTFIQTWGAIGAATGAAVDPGGVVYIANPSFGNNVIEKRSPSDGSLGTMTATIDGQWIEDMGNFGGGFILAGTYEGNVYKLSTVNAAHTLMFSTTDSFVGVTFDGTNIWTTGGLTNNLVYKRTLTGTVLATFDTGQFNGGIGYDPDDGTLWIGHFTGQVTHHTQLGALLGGFSTGIDNFIDGLELRTTSAGVCQHEPHCDDHDPCTIDFCDPVTGDCSKAPACDDHDACTIDYCDPVTGDCSKAPVNCDDGNCCTIDDCNPATGCFHTANTTPPVFVNQPSLGACPMLWPPQHGYVDFTFASTGATATSTCGIASIGFGSCYSSQPDNANGVGDGNSTRDCVYTPGTLSLRAERDGACSPLGRVYTSTAVATDVCGNTATSGSFNVYVWHDRGHGPSIPYFSANPGSNQNDTRAGLTGTWGPGCGPGIPASCDVVGQPHDGSDADPEMEIIQNASISVGNLAVARASGGNVKLTWTEPAHVPGINVTRFHVYRLDPVTLFWTQIAEVSKQTTSYQDPVLNDGRSWQYKVTAVIK